MNSPDMTKPSPFPWKVKRDPADKTAFYIEAADGWIVAHGILKVDAAWIVRTSTLRPKHDEEK